MTTTFLILLLLSVVHARDTFPQTSYPSSALQPPHRQRNTMYWTPLSQIQKTTLRITDIKLDRLGDEFLDSSDVTDLILRNNGIERVSVVAFRKVPSLRFLDLSRNFLKETLLHFDGHENLKMLLVDENSGSTRLNHLVDTSSVFPNLEHLSLQKNNLTTLHLRLDTLAPRLKFLHLTENHMDYFHKNATFPASLTHLFLDENRLRNIRPIDPASIVYLSMESNNVTHLCKRFCDKDSFSLAGAKNLKTLNLRRNRISDVDTDTFQEATRLTQLDLSVNKIDILLSDVLEPLVMLQNFSASDNLLSEMPSFCEKKDLKTVILSRNRIHVVRGKSLCGASNLMTLLLNENSIASVEKGAFNNLTSLFYLDLSGNRLVRLPDGWMWPLVSLRNFFIERNNFTRLEDMSLTIGSIQRLHVAGNPLREMNAHSLGSTSRVQIFLGHECRKWNQENEDSNNDKSD